MPEHQAILANALEWVGETPGARLVISTPPAHGKSEVEVSACAWLLARGHAAGWSGGIRRVAFTCYGEDLAAGFSGAVRARLAPGSLLREVFDLPPLAGGGDKAWRFATEPANRPTCIGVGIGGGFTGKHADLILADDPIKTPEDARSDLYKRRLRDWWSAIGRTRLQPGGRAVIVATRWCEDDLSGWLLSQGGWELLNLPALDEADGALWPARFDAEYLKALRDEDPRTFAAMYQGDPTPAGGTVWQRAWFDQAAYEPLGVDGPPAGMLIATGHDTAMTVNTSSDYSAQVRAGLDQRGDIWVLNVARRRMEFPELLETVRYGFGGGPLEAAVIEYKVSGISAVQTIQREAGRPVLAVKADKDKEARARAVTPLVASGRVHVPRDAGGELLVSECCAFPNGKNDDVHDAFVHVVGHLALQAGGATTKRGWRG